MKKCMIILVLLLVVISLVAAGIYIAEILGLISERVTMWALFPVMISMACVACVIYAACESDEHKNP